MTADEALEYAAHRLETRAGNQKYQQAWKSAAKFIRSLKSEKSTNEAGANHLNEESAGSH